MISNKHKALTLEERRIIEIGVRNGSTKAAIAKNLGKDPSTIGKEIRLHRRASYKCSLDLECAGYKKCKHGRICVQDCSDYIPFHCKRRDHSPGACNGCSAHSSCRFNKFLYEAGKADREYRTLLSDARAGVNLTTKEARQMASIIKPLLIQGLSPYRILAAHPELGISEKTLYNYIEWQVFSIAGIGNLDLRRKTSRKIHKKVAKNYKKRADRSFLKDRLYEDYRHYIQQNPLAHVMQMDTVYNDGTNGPFIQTFKLIDSGLLLAVYHTAKSAQDMVDGVNLLESLLGENLFSFHAEVLLTDRGSEFSAAHAFEFRRNTIRRTRLFYCDPMQSGQKGSLEVHHEQLRYICPKGTDLYALGLTGQPALNEALSHINSAPLKSLQGKSPIEYVQFLYPKLWEGLQTFGLRQIPRDEITLRPYLLKPFICS